MKAKVIKNFDKAAKEVCFGIAFQVKQGAQYCKYPIGYQCFPLQSDAEKMLNRIQNELDNLPKEEIDSIKSQPVNKHQYVNL